MAKILVVGGAGYVGSAVCAGLVDRGEDVWVLDDLSRGHRALVLSRGLTVARAGDKAEVAALLQREQFDGVMHFAAFASVAESVREPAMYRENNVEQTRALIETMLENGVRRFIFSSTCAIFGDPGVEKIDANLSKRPISPYGETKLEAERMLEAFAREQGLQAIALRYFNAAGAEPGGRVGEWHEDETHLIPRVFDALERDVDFEVYGSDYATPDGTCIRDYVHVSDLARAHFAGFQRLLSRSPSSPGVFEAFNLGSGRGYSVLEIVRSIEGETGRKVRMAMKPRRPGDPPRLVASAERAKSELGFEVPEDNLQKIVQSAWSWDRKRRESKKAVFLDRDGTLNEDPGYLNSPDQLKLLPGVETALARLKAAGYFLVVVSNQSGVGRGLIEEKQLPRIHNELDRLIGAEGRIDHFELCYHHPDVSCDCRKPKPKLIRDAAFKLNVDVSRSFMVGDKTTDVRAGLASACRASILVRTGDGRKSEAELGVGEATRVFEDLSAAVDWILAQR